ncbi:MAG: polysaccharide biosynthesis tyrosine autokinase [Phormidesmis sp.]
MTDTSLPANTEPELGYGQLLQILWRRGPWLVAALVSGLGLAVLATLLTSPTYQSSMRLLVEPNVSKSISINANDTDQSQTDSAVALDYVTQLNLMRSQQFIEDVVIIFPDICAADESQADCIQSFQASLQLSQVEEKNTKTRIFEAVFTSDDPLRAKKSLEGLQHVYRLYNENQQTQRLDKGLALVQQQIKQVQSDLSDSQKALQQFRTQGGTIDPEKQSLEAATALEQLSQTRQVVQADYQEAQAQYGAIQQALAVDPQQAMMAAKLSQSGRYQALLDALQTTELSLSERLAVYTDADPIAQDLQAQRDRQVDLLRQESQRLLGPTASTSESDLLSNGQLGESSLALISEMVAAQVRLSGLAAREASLAKAQQSLQQQLDTYPDLIARYDRLQPEVETQRTSLEQLLETRQQLSNELAQGGFKWELVEPPDLGYKIAPKPAQNLALGAVAGLFLGGLLAYGRESMDTSIRTSADLKKYAGLPLLGALPESSVAARANFLAPSFLRSHPAYSSALSQIHWQPFREAVDLIYKNIQLTASSSKLGLQTGLKSGSKSGPKSGPKSVMVTSAVAGEGKTTLAIALALSAARSQKRVLLIDADLRRPSLHEQIGLSNKYGLTTLSDSIEAPLPVGVVLANTQIDILPAGSFSEDPVRLLNSHRMRELVIRFEQQYDFVVFDTSSVLGQVDALQIASLCEGVVIVSRLGHVTQSDLSQAIAILAPVNQLGIVANGSRDPISNYGSPFLPEPSFSNSSRVTQSEATQNKHPLSPQRH